MCLGKVLAKLIDLQFFKKIQKRDILWATDGALEADGLNWI